MKKRVLSVLLSLCMLFSLLPTTALAGEDLSTYAEVDCYSELCKALESSEITQILIVGSKLEGFVDGEYVYSYFDWEDATSLDLVSANKVNCTIKIAGTWNVPENVTVNLKQTVHMEAASSDIVVDGIWNIADYGCYASPTTSDSALTINGKLTTSLPSAANVPCYGKIYLNGRMELPGNTCQIETLVLGDRAEVVNTSNNPETNVLTMKVFDGGKISCPEGSATIQGKVRGNTGHANEAAVKGTYTLEGNLTVDEILLEGNKTVMISSGSHVTTKKLTANDTEYTPGLGVGGTLELNGAVGTTHTFTGGKVAAEIAGTLILRPGNALGDAESSVGVFAGPGTVKLFAAYDESTNTYSSKPTLFGESEQLPSQVDDSVTIWRNWSGKEEPGAGEEEPATGHLVSYTYPADLCDFRITDNNKTEDADIESGGIITIDEKNGSPAVLQIDAKEGYELDSVTMNGEDVTSSFRAIETTTGWVYLVELQITGDTTFAVTMKPAGGTGEDGGDSGNEGGTGGDSGDTSDLHKLSAPTNLHWGTFYTNQVTGDGFSYPGMISWKVADPGYDQILEIALYKGDVLQYTTEWDYYADAENPRVYRCDWDFSLSELDRGDGTYHFTVQAKGDGTTTSDSEIVPSPDWEYKAPAAQLTAPEIIGWSGTTAQWNTVSGENVGGYVVDFYYSKDNASATSTNVLDRISGYVKYNAEGGDPLTFREIPEGKLKQKGNGYYYFAVRTVSGDVTVTRHSQPSALSAAYYYTGVTGGDPSCDHSWETEWTTSETQHWHECANCDETTTKENHVPVTDAYVAPTLNSTGLTEGFHCGTCDKVLVAQETIPMLQKQDVHFPSDSNTSLIYGEEILANGFYLHAYNNTTNGGQLTYSSSDTSVATVDASTGLITVVGTGEVEIFATAAAVEGYVETTAAHTLIVSKAPLTVTANNKTITYGAAPANNGYTVSGLVNGDTVSVLTGTAAYTCDYAQYSKVGDYPITLSGLSAKNYDITFEPGTLTVEKASAYTITLGNLTQNVGSVSAVTAVVAPQDSTATLKVEYETVTAATACGHQHDSACGENGAACTHTSHDETCGYAAETRTWGTVMPTAKGIYNVRASLTASENLVVPAEPVYTTGTLEIKAQATIGGNSSGSSSSNKNDSLEMGSGSNSVAVDVKVENGSAEVIVTDKDLEKILDNVPASGEMVVDLTSVNGAEELVLPAKLVEALSESSETKELTVVSEAAEITMGADVMETLAETITGTNDKVSVELTAVEKENLTKQQQRALEIIAVDAVVVELTMMVNHYDEKGTAAGQTQLHELGGKVDVRVAYELPKNMAGKHVVVSYVSDNGTVTYLRANYVDGYVCFTTDHFSTYAVFVNHAASFQDIDLNAWYAANVDFVAANGLMTGTSDTTFNPGGKVSRQQTWMILARMAGYAPEDMAAAKGWAVSTGVSDGTNAVNAVTRQQLVTLLWRAEGAPEGDLSVLAAYPDAGSVSEYAREAMAWAVETGVIGGTAQGTLNPQGTASRTQLAAILHRCIG